MMNLHSLLKLLAPGCFAALSACVHGALPRANAPSAVAADTSLFAAIIKSIADSTALPLRIDARPLLAGRTDALRGNWATVSSAVIDERRQSVARLKVREGSVDIPDRCGGVLLPDIPSEKSGCPKTLEVWAAVALPTPLGEPARRDSASVKVPITTIGPRGFSTVAYDYVTVRRGTSWLVLRRSPVGVVE